ncbi:MAG: HD domain-containing protein [Sedimentisphaerales bacterium]|nr:HD domain-containing protein [Sedimentisphaerales bacterium]
MEQEKLQELELWFNNYVSGFYGSDEYINNNLKLKEEHSRRTCQEMRYLIKTLGLEDNLGKVALVTALLHDVGRFEQFVKYRTYNDFKSVNHCLLGVKVLRESKVLEDFDPAQRELIEKAVEYHGIKELPKGLNGQHLLLSQLIRDADKLDVLYVVTEYYARYKNNPEDLIFELEFPDLPECSSQVVKATLAGQRIDYSCLKTLNDMRLLQLAWVYDVNFTATLRRIRQRGFLEKIIEFLPKTGKILEVKKAIFEYVDNRIGGDSQKERLQI